ncbi:hypothetical protein HYH03_008108 [Edaphochlamys debaryana]|uniref:SCP domain-containing protein n=1 Tax=Edaphochlamys debaryana TaxID=47281 RepID=A0A835Y1J9_9CHLO|nr:hypothetical protein HYH03_008108 [Edaphochlamys debaryana]|eukprot:KAG2493589.1 hypothetical protein HYH03_008108 [Edaphochlamys debaryana]
MVDDPLLGGGKCADPQAILDLHNMYRSWHSALPLVWDTTLAAEAQEWADYLATKQCQLVHAGVPGENLFMRATYPKPDTTCAMAATAWYSEIVWYDWTAARPFDYNWPRNVGHFTQMIWADSSYLGCGLGYGSYIFDGAPAPGGCKVVACRYQGPGNWATNDLFRQNVRPLDPVAKAATSQGVVSLDAGINVPDANDVPPQASPRARRRRRPPSPPESPVRRRPKDRAARDPRGGPPRPPKRPRASPRA